MRAMGQKTMPARPRRVAGFAAKTPRQALAREDWIRAAKDALIRAGINAVKVVPLARRLHVTRGSFYWHFKSLSELHKELLKAWERTNTEPFERALLTGEAPHAIKEFQTVIDLWVQEKDYSPAFDTAVRDWARISKEAAAAVRRADGRRIDVLHHIFIDMGYVDPEALVRARIAYFHQVGYYTLQLEEDPEQRLALVPIYAQVLTGSSHESIRAAGASSGPTQVEKVAQLSPEALPAEVSPTAARVADKSKAR